MILTLDLPANVEACLTAQAQARNLPLPQYIAHLLCEQLPDRAELDLSPAERGHGWRASVRSLPRTPPLSAEAISRESIYGDRGL